MCPHRRDIILILSVEAPGSRAGSAVTLLALDGLPGFGIDDLAVFHAVDDGVRSGLVGADADGVVDGIDEDLAVADLAGVADPLGGLDDGLDRDVADDDLDLDLWQQFRIDLLAAVELGVSLGQAAAVDLADGHAGNADGVQGILEGVQFIRARDDFDLV